MGTIYALKQFKGDRTAQLNAAEKLNTVNILDGTSYFVLLSCVLLEDNQKHDKAWVEADIWKSYDKEEEREYYTVHLLFSDLIQSVLPELSVVHSTWSTSLDELSALLDEIINDILVSLKEVYSNHIFLVISKAEDFKALPISEKTISVNANASHIQWKEDGTIKHMISVSIADLVTLDCTIKDNGFVSLMENAFDDGGIETTVDQCFAKEQRDFIEKTVAKIICTQPYLTNMFKKFVKNYLKKVGN